MTDVVESRALRVRPDTPRRSQAAVARALGRRELGRIAVNPFVVLGAALTALALLAVIGLETGQLFNEDALIGVLVFPLAGMTLIATNICVLRGKRDGVEELFESLPAGENVRTAAHAISLLAPAAIAILLGVAAIVIARIFGGIGWPHWTEIATGAVLVVSGGLVGILLARFVKRSAVAPLVVVGIGFLEGAMGSTKRWQWNHLAPFMPTSDSPAEVWFRPRGAHLVYLVGICAVLYTVAILIRRRSGRTIVALIVALAITVGAAIAQSPLPNTADEVRFAAWIQHPETIQRCRTHQGVQYCAYPAYHELIARWRSPVEHVLAFVPAHVRARELLIRQRVPSRTVDRLRPSLKAALLLPARLSLFWWPDDGAIHPDLHWCGARWRTGRCEMILGNLVASWAVGLPIVRTGPPATDAQRNDGTSVNVWLNEGLYDSSGQARAVVALWLTMQATPRARRVVSPPEEPLSRYPMNTCMDSDEAPESAVSWSVVDTGYARRMAELPDVDVVAFLQAHWTEVTNPRTTTEQLAAMLKIDTPTSSMFLPLGSDTLC